MDDEEEEEEESVQFDILSIETVSPPVDVSTADHRGGSADSAAAETATAAAAVVSSSRSSSFNLDADQKKRHQQQQIETAFPRRQLLPFISPSSSTANDTLAPNQRTRRHATSSHCCDRNTAAKQNTGPKSLRSKRTLSPSPSSFSKSSKSTENDNNNECTCLKHCARRPPSPMEECLKGTTESEQQQQHKQQQHQKEEEEEVDEEEDDDDEEEEEEEDETSCSLSEQFVNSDPCKSVTTKTTSSSTTENLPSALTKEQRLPQQQQQPQDKEVDLAVNITLKRRKSNKLGNSKKCDKTLLASSEADGQRCVPSLSSSNMLSQLLRADTWTGNGGKGGGARRVLFPLILILSITALVLLHNGSLRTRKAPTPSKFFTSGNPFITEFEFGQLKDLWTRLSQNEISFTFYYAPWDSDCIRARAEIETAASHYGQQIFFSAINCWWPEGECRKYQNIRRYPRLVAHIRTEGEVLYKGPLLASYIIPFLDNVLSPLTPLQNEGELLDLRAKHDAVLLGYFNFAESPHASGYQTYLSTAIRALVSDPWRSVAFTVVTNARVAAKLRIDPGRESSLLLYVGGNATVEHFSARNYAFKPTAILGWIYSRAATAATLKWLTPSGVKSSRLADYIGGRPTFILFTPRSFILGISPYFDLLREIVLDYYNCDRSPVVRSLIHRNILRRRLLEDRLAELEERCHELLDEEEEEEKNQASREASYRNHPLRYSDTEDTCCHSQTVRWRSFGGARRGMAKRCLCTACVHLSLPKCPARCAHFDCLSTAARFLDDFEPNAVNNSAVYCNQIRSLYEPRYTTYYKISTSCSGSLPSPNAGGSGSENSSGGRAQHWQDVEDAVYQQNQGSRGGALSADEKISRMIADFEIQHCRRLKLGMNYTDLNFPESSDSGGGGGGGGGRSGQQSQDNFSWRANFTGLACARANRTLNFLALDSALYPAFAESLGIDVFNVPHSTVALIIDPPSESVHLLSHQIAYREVALPSFDAATASSVVSVPVNSYSKRSFVEFIKNFTEGTLPRFLRSQLVSSSGLCDLRQMVLAGGGGGGGGGGGEQKKLTEDEEATTTSTTTTTSSPRPDVICVPELNTVTMTQYVLGRPPTTTTTPEDGRGSQQQQQQNLTMAAGARLLASKDVILFYYAPWCGFCTSIAHIYLEVARFFAFSTDIVFARINGDANDLPWEYTVDRYPTIMIFPANKRSNSLVYPPSQTITKLGLMQFILKHGQPAVRIQTALAFCRADCLERSLATAHHRRRSLRRATRHNLQAQLLNRFEVAKSRRKLQAKRGKALGDSTTSSGNKLKNRAGQLAQYGHFLGANIRRLRRLERRQSLLSAFLLRRIELFRRTSGVSGASGASTAAVLEPYTEELSEALFGAGKAKRKVQSSKKSQQQQQQQHKSPKKPATATSVGGGGGKSTTVKAKVDAAQGGSRKTAAGKTTTATTKPRVPRKDEL